MIKSIYSGPRKVVHHRIDDDVLDDDEDLSNGNVETSSTNFKRTKISEELPSRPADYLTRTSDGSKNEEKQRGSFALGGGKFVFKSSSVGVSVVMKPSSASGNNNRPAKQDTKPPEEEQNTNVTTTTGLQCLCQNYESNEDD